MEQPKIRPIEAIPVQDNMICLRDPSMLSDKMLLVAQPVFYIISLFDGRHTILDIQAEFTRKFGELLFSDKVREIIGQLDESLFLENDRFYAARDSIIGEFQQQKVREATHAGSAYDSDPEKLRAQLKAYFDSSDHCANKKTDTSNRRLRGLIAPHIDIRRGGTCFASCYQVLADSPPAQVYVILGVSHVESKSKYILTDKDFTTPLGTLHADTRFIDLLQKRCDRDLCADEFVHRNEHSIEFQVLFLG